MRSDQIKLGFERAPHRGLLRATGVVGEGGPIAALIDGDRINIDLVERRLDVDLTPEQIKQRLARAEAPAGRVKSSWLRRYASLVTSANTGAVLKDL